MSNRSWNPSSSVTPTNWRSSEQMASWPLPHRCHTSTLCLTTSCRRSLQGLTQSSLCPSSQVCYIAICYSCCWGSRVLKCVNLKVLFACDCRHLPFVCVSKTPKAQYSTCKHSWQWSHAFPALQQDFCSKNQPNIAIYLQKKIADARCSNWIHFFKMWIAVSISNIFQSFHLIVNVRFVLWAMKSINFITNISNVEKSEILPFQPSIDARINQ